MRTVATGNEGSRGRFYHTIRASQTSKHTSGHILEAEQLRAPLDLHTFLSQPFDQQALMLVLGINQCVREWTETRAHVSEDSMCRLLTGYPEVHCCDPAPPFD